MGACWRALAGRPGIDLHVVHLNQFGEIPNRFLSDASLLQGISNEMITRNARHINQHVVTAVARRQPHVVVLCGWPYHPYLRMLSSKELRQARIVLGMDSPWQGTVAQRLARFRLAGLVKRLDLAVTSGERSYQYARHIGVPENRIRGGYYGFDNLLFCGVARERSIADGGWPRQFLFVGRYVPAKDLATLVKAYSLYRTSVSRPWGLTCCGAGVDAELLKGITGVVDAGFIPPRELPSVFRGHGAFVLPSLFEPWGVVIAEAAASGLPVVCTTACGAGVDLVRPYYNGLTVTAQDVPGLARAMRWIHEHESELASMGQRSQALAQPYSADAWATRWYNYFRDLLADATPNVA